MKKSVILFGLVFMFLVGAVVAELDLENQQRLEFGHVIWINNITTEPNFIVPGDVGVLKMSVENTGEQDARDLRITLHLPFELSFLNDISQKKITRLVPGEMRDINFNIIALPESDEGVYQTNLTVDYVNHIGEERQDFYDLSIIIKGTPVIFVEIDSMTVYREKSLGDVTFKFANNDVANVKFLTVQLMGSEDYEIISNSRKYVGDLDSDDYESVDFRIKLKKKSGEVVFPLRMNYKDALNNDYSEDIEVIMDVKTAKELGLEQSYTTYYVLGGLIVAFIGWMVYKNYKKRKRHKKSGLI